MCSSSFTVKRLLAILLLSVTSSPSWAQEDDPELRDRFLRGVAQTGRKLEQLSFRAKCAYTSQLTAVSEKLRAQYAEKGVDPGKIDIRKFNVAIRGAFGLESGLTKTGNVYFRSRNTAYAFALERSSEGERTTLQFVEQLGIDPSIDARIAELEETPRALALAAFTLWTDPLPRLVESDTFYIKRVYAVPSGTGELVHVEFDYLVDDPARRIKHRITDGFLVCDPAQEWALNEYGGTRYTYINKGTSVQRVVLELGESIGGIPIATKISRTTSYTDNPGTTLESVITVEVISHDVPEEEFYLSYYGLTEPNFGGSWLGTLSWYLVGGIVCIIIGVIIKWRMTGR